MKQSSCVLQWQAQKEHEYSEWMTMNTGKEQDHLAAAMDFRLFRIIWRRRQIQIHIPGHEVGEVCLQMDWESETDL